MTYKLRLLSLSMLAFVNGCLMADSPPKVPASKPDPHLMPSPGTHDTHVYRWKRVPLGSATFDSYEVDLQAMFGEIASVEVGDGTLSLTIRKSEELPSISISGIPTLYTFTSAHVMFLQWDGVFLCAALNVSKEIDEGLKAKIETMFRSHESSTAIEFRISDDRKSIVAIPAELRKECEEAQRDDEEEDGEPGATDNPDDAQRLREDH